jgi:hypothetical protein
MILLIYNFIFPIRLVVFPQFAFLLYAFLLAQIIYYRNLFNLFAKTALFLPTIFMCSIILLLAIFSIFFNQSNDFLGIVVIVKFIFAIVSSLIIIRFVISQYGNISLFILMKIMALSTLLVATACVAEFFIPEVKIILTEIIYDPPGRTFYADSFKAKGLASGGGSALSVGLATGAIISIFLWKNSRGLSSYFWMIATFIISISTLFVGRTGVFLILTFLIFNLVSSFSMRGFKFVALVSVATVYFYTFLNQAQIKILYTYSLEPIKNYFELGTFSSKSTNALSAMFYLPDIKHVLFGAGYWRYPTHGYLLSDVGYMKILMAFGVFGFIIFYSYQLFIYLSAYKYYRRYVNFNIGFAFLFSFFFIIEVKEEFFMQNPAFKMLILLVMFSFIQKIKLDIK